ncbi:MAG TPA: ZIP family metal transporter [Candidatus Dormibacteraeota bacterium]|nr:ZIP family metal transporter [Candidatus Dormibacteraeota bacterium]
MWRTATLSFSAIPVEAPFRATATRIAFALSLGVLAAGADLVGGFFVIRRQWSREYLKYFIALGAGFMLAVALLEMVPESLRLASIQPYAIYPRDIGLATEAAEVLLLVLAGYLLVHFFEHTLAPHFHFGEETHMEAMTATHVGYAAVLGLAIHTFFDGVAISSGLLVSRSLGLLIFVAIFLHKIPEGFTVASLMLASGQGKRRAFLSSAVLGVATLVGVALMLVWRAHVGIALPVSAGVTLYVAASDLIPEVNHEPGAKMALLVFLGVAIMLALKLAFHA